MKKKLIDAVRKPFRGGSSSSSTTPLSEILHDLSNSPPDFDLISRRLEEALAEIPAESKDEDQSESRMAVMLEAGSKVLEKFEKTADKISKQESPDGMSLLAKLLESTANVSFIGPCLFVVAVALDSYKTCNNNRTECTKLLQTALKLIGHLKELSSSPSFSTSHEKELDNAVRWILYTAIRIISMTNRARASRFLYALIDKKDLDTIHREVHETFPQLCLSTAISLLKLQEEEKYYKPKYQKPSNIVGMDSQIDEVLKDLDLKPGREGCTCVCVHAMGGAGKSTLAKFVYATAIASNLKGYYHCEVELALDETPATLIKKQKEILEKLLGSKVPDEIGSMEDGKLLMKDKIQNLKKPVFLVLDNLNLSLVQVHFIVPWIDVFKPGSAILVTTRYKRIEHSLKGLGFSNPLMKKIQFLNDEEARKLLYQSMYTQEKDVDERVRDKWETELLKACRGLPLALKVAGGVISSKDGLNNEEVWEDVVQSLRAGRPISGDNEEKDPLLSILKFSIDALSSHLKESFFDIIAFFNNEPSWYVAYAVGNQAMDDLKARHLIQEHDPTIILDEKDRHRSGINHITNRLTRPWIQVHDVVYGLGKRMMEEKGEVVIRSLNEFESLDSMKLPRNIRGIDLSPDYPESKAPLGWSRLCGMDNIRVLSGVTVEGDQFRKPLERLRVLFLDRSMLALENAPNLTILKGKSIDMSQMKMPRALKYLSLQNCSSLPLLENIRLEYLQLYKCNNLVRLEGIERLLSLKHLHLYYCLELSELEGLPALQSLAIHNCRHIERILPFNFSALCTLSLMACTRLKEIPFDTGNIHYLLIRDCPKLQHIPEALNFNQVVYCRIEDINLKQLPLPQLHWTHKQLPYLSLRHLFLIKSHHLKKLPKVFFRSFPNLETLDLSYCTNLISLPNCRGMNSQLRILRLEGCSRLETLDVSDLSRLEELDVSWSTHLKTCWINEIQPFQILNFSKCSKLESLRSMPILSLRYVKKLSLEGCYKVKKDAEDILQRMPPSMEEIDVTDCLNMEEVDECLQGKRLDVNVISRPSCWSYKMSPEEKMQKMSEVIQSLYFLDSKDNIIPGTDLQGNLVCLLFLKYLIKDWLERAKALHFELENAGKPMRFIYISSDESMVIPESWIKVSRYHTSSLLSLKYPMCDYFLITTVGNGIAHVPIDAIDLWKLYGLEGYPFTRDALAKVAKPLTLSSFLPTHTTLTLHDGPHQSQMSADRLTGKLVAIFGSWDPIPFFTRLTHAGEQLEFVWIPIEISDQDEAVQGQLVLITHSYLLKQCYVDGGILKQIDMDNKVVVFDKEGNLLNPDAYEACMRYGVANAFPFTPEKIASLPDQPFLNSPLHFLLCNIKLQTATLPTTEVSLQSFEGSVACFVIIRICSQQSLEMVVKDYQNLKAEWKEQVRIVSLLKDNLKVQATRMIPPTWLIADSSSFVRREGLKCKKTDLLNFLRQIDQCWCLGFDGKGEMIREGADTRLFARYLLEKQVIYNEDVEENDRSTILTNEVGRMSLNSKIIKAWESPSAIKCPQHPYCKLYIGLNRGICYICREMEYEWKYSCRPYQFHICLDCHT